MNDYDETESIEMAEKSDRVFGLEDEALNISWVIIKTLRLLMQESPTRAREWAIAATEAEKLHAWIGYAMTVGQSIMEDDA